MRALPAAGPRWAGTSLALLLTLLGAGSGSAAAATAEIGAVAEIRAAEVPSPITNGGFAVQVGEARGSYAVPPGYHTITAWSHSAGTTAGALTFKVYRPTGALREFTAVASDTRFVTARSVQTFAVQIPVLPGDRIGLSSDEVEMAYETFVASDRIGFFGAEVPPGAIRATDGQPFEEFKLDVSATVSDRGPASPGGSSAAAPSSHQALLPPSLQRLIVVPRAFAAARRGGSTRATRRRGSGAKVSYRLDVAATVRFTVQRIRGGRRRGSGRAARCVIASSRNRRAPRCTRYVPLRGSFSRKARAGANSFYFTGRVGGRKLTPGLYRLMATPTATGLAGGSRSRMFRITR